MVECFNTTFRGGRTQAGMSGLNARYGRGRVNYVLDVNSDGILDIVSMESRRFDNIVAVCHDQSREQHLD